VQGGVELGERAGERIRRGDPQLLEVPVEPLRELELLGVLGLAGDGAVANCPGVVDRDVVEQVDGALRVVAAGRLGPGGVCCGGDREGGAEESEGPTRSGCRHARLG